jgi:hypothetical protein
MDDFERQLKQAMARKDAPVWFEAKVLAAVERQPQSAWSFFRLRWAAAAVASVLLVSGIAWQQRQESQERVAGERAKAQLELALRITSQKLQHIERQLEAAQERN